MREKSVHFSCFPQEKRGLEDCGYRGRFYSVSGLVLIQKWKEGRMELIRRCAEKLNTSPRLNLRTRQHAPALPQAIRIAPVLYMSRLGFRNICPAPAQWTGRQGKALLRTGWETQTRCPYHMGFLPLICPRQGLF